MKNEIKNILCSLNICDEASIEAFHPKVRDRDDVAVLKCRKSGVIFLSRSDHMEPSHYEGKKDLSYWGEGDRQEALKSTAMDDQRRAVQFHDDVSGKVWLDLGTGLGGILDLLAPVAAKTFAIEPQLGALECLGRMGYEVRKDIKDIDKNSIEVATLFHVLEHFIDPIGTLRLIKERMKKGGKVIVEVPHAKDFLITTLDNEAFKSFTFWSEHLILHTRESLNTFLKEAGFSNIVIHGFQRYPISNHLYWLAKGKPDGQTIWKNLRDPLMESEYSRFLDKIDQTDTLIAVAEA